MSGVRSGEKRSLYRCGTGFAVLSFISRLLHPAPASGTGNGKRRLRLDSGQDSGNETGNETGRFPRFVRGCTASADNPLISKYLSASHDQKQAVRTPAPRKGENE